MKTYILTLKNDNGRVRFSVRAENEQSARRQICRAENCPDRAILDVKQLFYYVTMTDKFMSGWGMADGKTNKFVIACENWAQATAIERAAMDRDEMKYINIARKKPYYNPARFYVSEKSFSELGGNWLKYYNK